MPAAPVIRLTKTLDNISWKMAAWAMWAQQKLPMAHEAGPALPMVPVSRLIIISPTLLHQEITHRALHYNMLLPRIINKMAGIIINMK